MKSVIIDLTGMTYDSWYVVDRADNIKKRVMWNCICKCGQEKVIQGTSLKNGVSKSCGCKPRIKRTHGLSDTNIYRVWQRMKGCTNSKTHQDYKHYGGRGIKMCEEWYCSFEEFHKWAIENNYRDGLEIDRTNNNGDYEPDNCRWVTRRENMLNTRNTIFLTFGEETKPLSIWAEELNMEYGTLYSRIYDYNWSVERALSGVTV